MDMGRGHSVCKICGKHSAEIAEVLGVCERCIADRPEESLPLVERAHRLARSPYGLPPKPPQTSGGVRCVLCSNECQVGRGETSFCGLRVNRRGKFTPLCSPNEARVHSYLDAHPTNCCSSWFCPGGTGAGYPRYAARHSAEYGYSNLSVFFYGCGFDCLFCQNASHKNVAASPRMTREELIAEAAENPRVTCVCYFGGSPEPQMPFALKASSEMLERVQGRVLRICWEWNGCGNTKLAEQAAELSLRTGGNVKFDLKVFDPNLSLALSGVPNQRAFRNFQMIYDKFYMERPNLPVLTATTLLVPGYVDVGQVDAIARFIAELNPEIPYSLLAFYPAFHICDLPTTSKRQAKECYEAAARHLKNVNIGNRHLIGLLQALRE